MVGFSFGDGASPGDQIAAPSKTTLVSRNWPDLAESAGKPRGSCAQPGVETRTRAFSETAALEQDSQSQILFATTVGARSIKL